MKTDVFQSCGHCWVFQICWHIEYSTFTASSFRIWNSSTGIPSPPLALFIVMLSKAHLTSHSRMSGSRRKKHKLGRNINNCRYADDTTLMAESEEELKSLLMKVKVKSLSRIRLFSTPWTAAYQAPPSMRSSRQEYWSGVPLPSLKLNSKSDKTEEFGTSWKSSG